VLAYVDKLALRRKPGMLLKQQILAKLIVVFALLITGSPLSAQTAQKELAARLFGVLSAHLRLPSVEMRVSELRNGGLSVRAVIADSTVSTQSEHVQADRAKQVAVLILNEIHTTQHVDLITVGWKSAAGSSRSLTMLYSFTPGELRDNPPRTRIN
jgi:hypothetical protein